MAFNASDRDRFREGRPERPSHADPGMFCTGMNPLGAGTVGILITNSVAVEMSVEVVVLVAMAVVTKMLVWTEVDVGSVIVVAV